jgi:hypothetical protein
MQSSPQPEQPQCPICRAEVSRNESFCGACGSKLADTPAEEIRSLNYLLSELSRWETDGIVEPEQAGKLRESYEERRDVLRAQLKARREQARQATSTHDAARHAPGESSSQRPPATNFPPPAPQSGKPRRALLETLSDPHTIRLLLYTGAAMLVVGVVVWLHDILYLKLQEPIVQATLLIIGTIAVTVSGWLTILRTRLRLTGRALTLTGSLLVPVNFWFLVRSGLLENNGRAWLVCAFCAALYALTASFLRERLYVYLASIAVVATAWTITYRVEREAFGLYALTLMIISLIFLHLSQLFPAGTGDGRRTKSNPPSSVLHPQSPLSAELWSSPLVHVALAGVWLSLLLYMPLRFGSPSFDDGSLRPLFSYYDSRIAILLFAAAAYATWFTGQSIFTNRRTLLYTLSTLCLFWAEFLAADGQELSGSVQLLLLAATAFLVALVARVLKSDAWALALHRASLIVTVALAVLTYPVISAAPVSSLTHSLILILLASTYAISGSLRFSEGAAASTETSTHVSLAFSSAAVVVLEAIIYLRVGDASLLTPSLALGAIGLVWFGASLRAKTQERVRYFRAGLLALIIAFTLAALSTGFDPISDVEIYTSPVAVLLLVVAYLFARRQGEEYTADAGLLLWAGSLLLAAPLLMHALQYRLFLTVPAPWRDLATLCASLALLIVGIVGRLRAPVLVGATALLLELSALALTSVNWLQIPLKVYLLSTGALILLIWGLLEFRREQILLMRRRLQERREYARERFGEWK